MLSRKEINVDYFCIYEGKIKSINNLIIRFEK